MIYPSAASALSTGGSIIAQSPFLLLNNRPDILGFCTIKDIMSFFGVELNAQVNKLNLQARLNLSRNRHIPNLRTVYKSLSSFDKGDTGVIHIQDFEKALNQNGLFFKKFQIQAYQKAFTAGDHGLINWKAFLSCLKQPMSSERRQLVERVFDSMDPQKTGVISIQTLNQRFNPLQFKQFKEGSKTKDALEGELLSLVNADSVKGITKEEFVSYYDDLNINIPGDQSFRLFVCSQWSYDEEKNPQNQAQEVQAALRQIRFKLIQKTSGTHQEFLLKKVFDEFDSGKMGSLRIEDLYMMLVKLEVTIEERLLKPLFDRFDRNKSGLVEYDEFKNFLFFDPFKA